MAEDERETGEAVAQLLAVASNALLLKHRSQGRLLSLCCFRVTSPPPLLCRQPEHGGSIYGSTVKNVGEEYDTSEMFYNQIEKELESTKV